MANSVGSAQTTSSYFVLDAVIPRLEHGNADGLSRLPLQEPSNEELCEATGFNLFQIATLPVTAQQVQTNTRADPILSKVVRFTNEGWPKDISDDLLPFKSKQQELTLEGGCLLWGVRVIVPAKLRPRVLQELHLDHPGVSRMKSIARSYVWWPGLDKAIEELAKSCLSCQSIKTTPPVAPLHPWVWPTKPWQRIHVDFAGPFMGRMFLLAVDAHSKWPEVVDTPSVSTENYCSFEAYVLDSWFAMSIGL